MSYVKHYIMVAATGRVDDLREILSELEAVVRDLPGSRGVELLRSLEQPEIFYFIERWDSKEGHRAAGGLLPKDLMERIGPTLANAPVSASLSPLNQKAS